MSDLKMCTSCMHFLPPDAFIYKNKNYKTCSDCLTTRSNKRAEKKVLSTNNQLDNMIAFTEIIEYVSNQIASIEQNSKIFFSICVKLDNDILVKVNHNMRLLVRLIVDEIKEGDGYNWTVGTFYLPYSQSCELEREYKESNRKRMTRFDCHSKLVINVDVDAKEIRIKLSHDIQHEKPINVMTSEEIKREIMLNIHMNPVQIRTHLHQKFDISQVTPKQINYWWSVFNQHFFKLDKDLVTSAHRFLENPSNNSKFCYE
ncbi:13112_t:CDS:2 [Racocetra fulgida]|uniref:13112_t:CDS:1 n=1 Tax=Racocetra fulgida TaxID=60492 RepID=A0A9N8Z003_9GLOM|nr:13112_t:CDS:2 [Racocetra fulgida]